jgi:hypothetical protein
MKLELEIDVPESREVTLTLPPETPVGKVKLTVQTAFDPLAPIPGENEKFERERRAFFRLLPELLKTHYGKVVAIHDEQVLVVGDETVPVAMEAYKKVGYVALFVQRVLEKQPVYRLKTPREIRREGS